MVKFGDMAKHISKRVEPTETNLNIYVGLEHLDPDSLRIKRHGVPSDVEGQKLLVKKGQIIFGKRRAYQRKLGVADWDCICSAHAMVLEANSETVIPEFLPFFMLSNMFMNRAVAISEGSLSPTIKWKSLAQQEFPMPDKTNQKKIVEVCQKIFDVENSLLTVKEASLFARRRISDNRLIYDIDGNPWKKVKAFNVCELITKGASPRWQGFEYVDNGTLFVTSENVLNEIVDISEPKFIPNEFSEVNLKRSRLKKDDVLVNIVGASIGRCAIWDGSYKNANVNQAVALMRPSSDLDPRWLLAQFYSTRGQRHFGLSKVDNARPNVSLTSLGEFEIPLPPIKVQKNIMDKLALFPDMVIEEKIHKNRDIFNAIINRNVM